MEDLLQFVGRAVAGQVEQLFGIEFAELLEQGLGVQDMAEIQGKGAVAEPALHLQEEPGLAHARGAGNEGEEEPLPAGAAEQVPHLVKCFIASDEGLHGAVWLSRLYQGNHRRSNYPIGLR